jgi:Tol biopolymer transport system component
MATRLRRTDLRRSISYSLVALFSAILWVGAPSIGSARVGNGRIAFSAVRLPPGPIVVAWRPATIAPDGSDLRPIDLPATFDPAWSPDGTRIAWGHATAHGPGKLLITTPNGRVVRTVVRFSKKEVWTPTWAANGRRLAFCTYDGRSGQERLWSVRRDGSHLSMIGRLGDCDPEWSPDGRWIAAQNQNFSLPVVGGFISLMRPDGTDRRIVAWNANGPSWSPDGSRIAFNRFRNSQSDVFSMASDGSDVVRLTHTRHRNEISPDWSPNGARIVLSSRRENGRTYDLWVLALGTGDRTRLTGTPRWDELGGSWQAR